MKTFLISRLSLLILFLSSILPLHTQEIVVSEYYNFLNNPSAEWTELLVVSDDISLVNYVLRDNDGSSGTPDSWQGGIVFKDIRLWQHLRAGTVIVIRHRGTALTDTNKMDGYLEVSAENTDIFQKQPAWDDGTSLNIDEQSDLIEILNSTGRHVHMLGHMASASGDFNTVTGNKAAYNAVIGTQTSVKVVPGRNLAAYNSGFGNSQTDAGGGSTITLGKANNGNSSTDENQLYWRSLREPSWNSPQLALDEIQKSVLKFSWNRAEDNYSNDQTQGYLVVRIPKDQLAAAQHPADGKNYTVGQKIGSAVVAGVRNSSGSVIFNFTYTMPCDDEDIYRVYAFRYDPSSDLSADTKPENGRGRSYNTTSYAELEVINPTPEKPVINIIGGSITLCSSDTAILQSSIIEPGLTYEWYRNGVFVGDESDTTILMVRLYGMYRLKIVNPMGCFAESDEIEVTVIDDPVAVLRVENNPVNSDQDIVICDGESVEVSVSGGETQKWYKDGSEIADTPIYNITQPGTYYAVALNQNQCTDTTVKVTVLKRDIDVSADNNSLNFTLTESDPYLEQNVIFTNNSNEDVTLKSVNLPNGFSVSSPNPPWIVTANSILTLTIRYSPVQTGTVTDQIDFIFDCDFTVSIAVSGFKPAAALTADPGAVKFADIVSCVSSSQDTTVKIINSGASDITVIQPIVNAPFSVVSATFPQTVAATSDISLTVRFDPAAVNNFAELLYIPYTVNNSDYDTLKISLEGNKTQPEMSFAESEMSLEPLTGCDEYLDFAVEILNGGTIPLVIQDNSTNTSFDFLNLPLQIPAGTSADLNIRYTPASEGTFDIDLPIIAQPCDISKTLTLHTSKQGISFSFDADTLDFGKVISCIGEVIEASLPVEILISGASNESPTVFAIETSGDFNTDLILNQDLDSGDTFNVSMLPGDEGKLYGHLTVTIKPCDIEKTIFLTGERYIPKLSLNLLEIDFNNVNVSDTRTLIETVSNNTDDEIVLGAVDNVFPPFYMNSSSPELPLTMAPGSSYIFSFDFSPSEAGVFSNEITFITSSPCNIDTVVTLNGTGVQNNKINLRVSLDKTQTALPGETAIIPLMLESDDLSALQATDISKGTLEFNFNPFVMNVLSAQTGNALKDAQSTITSLTENVKGTVKIQFDIDNTSGIQTGTLLNILVEALYNEASSTTLYIDDMIFNTSSTLAVNTVNGLFSVEDFCQKENRVLEVGGEVTMKMLSANPAEDIIDIGYSIVSEDNTTIRIYDAIGNVVAEPVNSSLTPGVYNIMLSTENLSDGAYFAVMHSGTSFEILRFSIIK